MLTLLFDKNIPGIYVAGITLLVFAVTFFLTSKLKSKLPQDIGRKFAVNAEKAKGKPRGAGIIFVTCFCILSFLFAPFDVEYSVYLIFLLFAMMTGFLDDASKIPWSDYKKGILDLLISVGVAITFAAHNDTSVVLRLVSVVIRKPISFEIPYVVYVILATVLIWMAINVVNCTDGVDGLCTSLTTICLISFMLITKENDFLFYEVLFLAALIAYLWFNASPSIILMGDAGSRTIGVFLAIAAMKCGDPFLFLPICIVFIVDGGIGLVKIFLKRFLKISILKNTRTPLHDEARKVKDWSDTQTVIRFCIIQLLICALVVMLTM
ncbi:MAG: phospho-N-acetylmuramoyl-pentapeptide-transferase [Lachnospiraceae bacterium]|nr:phospho-N-acetylmuramoyl-pentapeptide-transferase [Lachnospiraceae bacterium]